MIVSQSLQEKGYGLNLVNTKSAEKISELGR